MPAEPTPELQLRCRVPQHAAGQRLLDFLSTRFRYHDRSSWAALIAAGAIRVDDEAARPDTKLGVGAVVGYRRQQPEPWADTSLTVLHVDADLVAVDKPAHLPAHADGPFVRKTLVAVAREALADPALDLVHRLDRETSGVCLLARTKRAGRALRQQFEVGAVHKLYHAVIAARIASGFVVDAPIGHAPGSLVKLRRTAAPEALSPQPATTRFEVERTAAHGTLLRCKPEQGRTHQIRVHLEHNGTPVLGDKLYGRPDADYVDFVRRVKASGDVRTAVDQGPDRHLLHSSSLTFTHPTTGLRTVVAAPLPPAFQRWLDAPGD